MKSTKKELYKRGYIENNDLLLYEDKSYEELIDLLNSKYAQVRSYACVILGKKFMDNTNTSKELIKRLKIENALYTRLHICAALENGNSLTVKEMINYLGEVGNNQYKILPKTPSKKKSYPLPRDIIARSLGKMNLQFSSKLTTFLLTSNDVIKIRECIDAFGWMCFYNEKLQNKENLNIIIHLMEKYKNDKIIIYKCIIAVSAFNLKQSYELLNNIIKRNNNENIFYLEATRSLNIIKSRK